MADVIGIAIEPTMLRAVARARGSFQTVEIAWDPERPETGVQQLRERFGRTGALALSIGLGFLEIARPALPPLRADDRQRALLRDAQRYFPLEGSLAIAAGDAEGMAFALPGDQLDRWVQAFEQWAPVRAITSAPEATVLALASRGRVNGSLAIDCTASERGLLSFRDGAVVEVRRLPESLAREAMNGTKPLDLSALGATPPQFASAVGALRAVASPVHAMLLDAPLLASFKRSRRTRLWQSYAALLASLVILGVAMNHARTVEVRATMAALDSLTPLAQRGIAAKARLAEADSELQVLNSSAVAARDPLAVLAAVSRALPRDAFVDRLDWDGHEWHLSGSVNQSAAIVPSLDAAPGIADARMLSASTRFRDGNRMRESFAVAFTVGEKSRGR